MIYQVAWIKALGLIFGHTVYAIATVLAAFMGGLALGNALLSRVGDRSRNPVALYGWIELAIAVTGVLSLFGIQGVRSLYLAVFPVVSGSVPLLVGLRFVAAMLVLLAPTFLMGGTLPILVRGLGRGSAELGEKLGRLYWVNTAGAVAGTLAAGLVLLPFLGLRKTVLLAVGLNVAAGLVALLLRGPRTPEAAPSVASAFAGPQQKWGADRWFLLLSFGVVGASAMVYEVAWTRLLATALGSTTYAFTVMLATFLVGIVIGSQLFERWVARGGEASLRTYAATQTLIGLTVLLFLAINQQLPTLAWNTLEALEKTFGGLLLAQFGTSALAMLPAAVVFGFNFPLVTMLIAGGEENRARRAEAVGRACAANTLGAIGGATAAGFWLVPLLGSFRVVALTAAVNLLLALLLEHRRKPPQALRLAGNAVLVSVVAVVGWFNLLYDPTISNFGPIYYMDLREKPLLPREAAYMTDLLFAEDGLNASIAVVRTQNYLALRTNGKVDASTLDTVTQLMLGHLGASFHPAPRRVLVIGFGSGMTVKALAQHKEVERIDCVEIEPAVIRAASFLEPLHEGVLNDPRVRVILDDARNFLLTTRERYDLIVSEPSNPWIAGIATLFTDEFYREVRARLAQGGILVQWVQAYSLYPEDLRMVMATLLPHFPHVTLWHGLPRDLILLGRTEPGPLSLDHLRARWAEPAVRASFEQMGLQRPEGLLGFYLQDDADLRRLVTGSLRNTDDHTRLEYRAPLSLFAATSVPNHEMLDRNRTQDLPADLPVADRVSALASSAEALMNLNEHGSARRFIRLLEVEKPTALSTAVLGRWYLQGMEWDKARQAFQMSLRLDPPSLTAAHALAEVARRQGDSDGAERALRRLLESKPDHLGALRSYALLEEQRKRWEQAALWQSRRILADPRPSPEEYASLGEYWFNVPDDQKAEAALVRALQLDPYNFRAHRKLSEVCRRGNRWDQARLHLEIVVRYHPVNEVATYLSLADVYRQLERPGDAADILRVGRRLFPDDKAIAQALATS